MSRNPRLQTMTAVIVGGVLFLASCGTGSGTDRTEVQHQAQAPMRPEPEQPDVVAKETLDEFLLLDDARAVRARYERRHFLLENAIEECMLDNGFAYLKLPPEPADPEDLRSPLELARTSGFGVTDNYLAVERADTPTQAAPRFSSTDVPFIDPNTRYIESLDETSREAFFRQLKICVDSANEMVLGPIEDQRRVVSEIVGESKERMTADPEYLDAEKRLSSCMSVATGLPIDDPAEAHGAAVEQFAEMAQSMHSEGDHEGLRELRVEEISMAVAMTECSASFEQEIAPIVRMYESRMIAANRSEFELLRDAQDAVLPSQEIPADS